MSEPTPHCDVPDAHRPRAQALLAAALCAALLPVAAGCAKQPSGPAAIRVWHWMTDREEAFAELATRYTAQTQIPVRFELYAPTDLYVQKVRAAAQTNGLPDVYGVLGELRDVASFIHAGHVLSLSKPMAREGGAWQSRFFPIALRMNTFPEANTYGVPPGIYGVPIDVMNIQLFYNKKLLAKLGFDPEQPPRDWDAFLEVGKRAKQQDMIGMVSGWAELWMIDCFAMNYAVHLMGREQVEATFRGEVAYSDPRWVEVLKVFQQLRDSGLLAEDIVTMVNKRAEQLFANEQAVFAFNGSWGVNVYRGMNPELQYGVMMPPAILRNRPVVTWGGAGSSFMVNGRSARAQDSVAFLEWLTAEPQQQYLLETTHNIPANRLATAQLPPELAAFADDMDAVVHPRLFGAQEHSTVIETFDKGVQSILIGEETPLQVAQAVEQVKQREETHQASLPVAREASHATR